MDDKKMLTAFAVASLVTMGFGIYKTLKKGCRDQCRDYRAQEEKISKELQNLNSLQTILSKKAQQIELRYSKRAPHILSEDCLKQIMEFTSEIVDKQQLETIYKNNRRARRSCFKAMRQNLGLGISLSLENYYRFVCTFEEQLQYLIEISQKDFVVFLNLDYTTITESIDFYTCQPDSDFATWIRRWSLDIKEQLREQLSLYSKPVPKEQILEIAQFQIQTLGAESDNLKQAVRDLNLQTQDQKEALPTFLQTFLEDIIYEKYGVQIEQTHLDASELTIEWRQKINVLKQLRSSVLQELMSNGSYQEDFSQEYDENDQ